MAPVGSLPSGASVDGIMDLGGNVWEWVISEHKKGEMESVIRGGGWHSSSKRDARCRTRTSISLDTLRDDVGFRCARSKE